MDLEQLGALGGFVDDEPVKKTIVWKKLVSPSRKRGKKTIPAKYDEIKFEAWIRKISWSEAERIQRDVGDPEDPTGSYTAAMVAACVWLGEKGDSQMTYTQAMTLQPGLMAALSKAVQEVNGDPKHETSTPSSSSGTTSSQPESEAEQSQKPKSD